MEQHVENYNETYLDSVCIDNITKSRGAFRPQT